MWKYKIDSLLCLSELIQSHLHCLHNLLRIMFKQIATNKTLQGGSGLVETRQTPGACTHVL